MNPAVRLVQYFCRFSPWQRYKPRIAQWAERFVPHETAVFRNLHGWLSLELDTSTQWHREVLLHAYEMMSLRVVRKVLRPGDVFVDGGANIGLFSLVAAGRVGPEGRVHAFEPEPETRQRLERNVELNGLNQVCVHPEGLWDEDQASELHLFGDAKNGLHSMSQGPKLPLQQTVQIRTTRLDRVIDQPVRLIKLDIEGAEWPALRGASGVFEHGWPHVLLELNNPTALAMGYSPLEMLDWFEQSFPGYRLHLVRTRRIQPTTREAIAARIEREPKFYRNLWLQPPG